MAVRRILAIQLKRLGDLVLTVPALSALRASGAHVTLLTESPFDGALASESPPWDELRRHPRGWRASLELGAGLGKGGFDVAIDFQGSATSARLAWQSGAPVRIGWRLRGRRLAYTTAVDRNESGPPRHTADRKLDLVRAIGLPATDAVPRLRLTDAERADGRRRLIEAGRSAGSPSVAEAILVALPASRREYKRWPPGAMASLLDGFAGVTRASVVLVGGPGEEDQLERVRDGMSCAPSVIRVDGIRAMMAILCAARAAVGPDGGARQMAEALDVPTLALFGPQDPIHWTRLSNRHRAIRGRRPDCAIRCNRGKQSCACLASQPVESVLAELLALWRDAS